MTSPFLALAALAFEGAFGYPAPVFARIGHPVTWIGRMISWLDVTLNHENATSMRRRRAGMVALVVIVASPVVVTVVAQQWIERTVPPNVASMLEIVVASTLLAQRSLREHVRAVLTGLYTDGLAGGRAAVSRIVGRDPASLDNAGVVRAAIESLAENFSDGVVTPLFWMAVLGLPGAVAYKAINTADSMIGHLTPRHRDFGRAAALCDDFVNLPASRLAAIWIVMAASTLRGADPKAAWAAMRADARKHRSPNAGWPEAAMAGALGLRLAGPRKYDGVVIDDCWMGRGRAEAKNGDLAAALSLYIRACIIEAVVLLLFILAQS